jgi:phosphoribosyl-ATP pyrophosphohydrolase
MKTDLKKVEEVAATEPTQKKIEDYSTTELKALVYDLLVTIEAQQANIKFINEELKKRG